MPGQTPRGYSYPLDTDPLSQLAQIILNLAGQVNDRAGISVTGTAPCTGNGSAITALSGLITFPAWFTNTLAGTAPRVFVQPVVPAGAATYLAGYEQRTATTMRVQMRRLDGGVIANGAVVNIEYLLRSP